MILRNRVGVNGEKDDLKVIRFDKLKTGLTDGD